MNKKQLKTFKKITKGTKKNPTTVLTTWEIWHCLPTKIQNSKLRNIVVISKKADWKENCWCYSTITDAFQYHCITENVVVVGDSLHIQQIVNSADMGKVESTTVLDTDTDDDPYEFIKSNFISNTK